ncbi:MAG TPA: MG2 domain-containing protein, partial [Candidatus Obscuribacterales bacterium]
NPFPRQRPIATLERNVQGDDTEYARADFELDELPAGDYVVLAEVNSVNSPKVARSMSWFSVSDLGLIVKQAPDKMVVRAIDLNTLKPVRGVSINMADTLSLVPRAGLPTVLTGDDGFATINMSKQLSALTNYTSIALGSIGEQRAYGSISYWRSTADRIQTYFYTDRPVYRLGQTVYYKGLCRLQEPNGLKNPGKNMLIKVAVDDPDNHKLWSGNLRTSDHGTFHGVISIPENGKTGAYQVVITYPDNSTSYQTFEVAQYRKPEYQVEVKTINKRYIAGSKVRATIKASYFFGGAVANARVKYSVYASSDWDTRYRLMSRPDYMAYFDDWEGDEEQGYYYDYGGDYLTEGFAETDENGEAEIEFDTKKPQMSESRPYSYDFQDKQYKIEAEVTDISRLSVVSSTRVPVTAGAFALFVTPRSYVAKVGDSITVDVNAIDYDGKPMPDQAVTLKVSRFPWDRIKHEYKPEEVVAEIPVVTSKDGKTSAVIHVADQWPTDSFFITARAKDSLGNIVYDQNSVWIASPNYPYIREGSDAQQEPLNIKLDKSAYQPGETAKLMVSAPLQGNEGAEAIVSIEGPTIYSYRVVPIKATAQLIEVKIEESYAPNVYVSVALVTQQHQFYSQEKMIKVSPESHFLKFSIDTDKKKYKPGETVKYTVKATYRDGRPAPNTELSLGVVDESIYSVRPEFVQDIGKFFYRKRDNWVVTVCSFPEQYSGGPDKVEPELRKDFRDTAAWIPELITDKDGMATAHVKLPDNLTTWRATVRGINSATDVGSAINKVISSQDVIVRIALPRFFSQGDEGLVTAVVHNYSERQQNIKVMLSISSHLKTQRSLTTNMQLAPEKAGRYSWPVSAVSPGEAVIQVKAIGQTAGDWMEKKLPVRPLGIPAFSAKAGVITADDDQVSIPIGLSADAVEGTARYSLSIASSSLGPVIGNFASLIDYPYGCTEQTMSKLMPSIVAMQLHKKLGQPISAADRKKFADVYAKGMEKLIEHHHSDGGWGWWVDDASNPYLTSYVLEGLYLLRDCGFKPDPELSTSGRRWLRNGVKELHEQLSDPLVLKEPYNYREYKTDLARALYALSLWKEKPDAKIARWFVQNERALTPEALAYLTLAFNNAGDRASAQRYYDQLLQLANKSESFMDWDHTIAMLKRLSDRSTDSDYTYRFTGVESTALALRAVLAMEPENAQRIESIKQWLMIQRGKDGWENTKTTAEVFMALLQDDLIARGQSGSSFSAKVMLKDQLLSELAFTPQTRYAAEKRIAIPLTRTPKQVTIAKTGSGRLYYNSLVTYFRKLAPGDLTAEKASPPGLRLTRKFFRLESSTSSDGTIHYRTKPLTDGKIKAGETLLMKVLVDSPATMPYIIVDTPLPSGAEVVEDNRESSLESETGGTVIEGDWGTPWWTHQDVLDDKIVFFGTNLPQGKSEFHTLLRMELPGTIQINPVSLEGMYTKNVRGYSALDSLRVIE